jgi:hypothetical protein
MADQKLPWDIEPIAEMREVGIEYLRERFGIPEQKCYPYREVPSA